MPVPIHRKRLWERDCNQPSLLAQKISKLTNLPMVDNSLNLQWHALPQTQTKTMAEYRNNVSVTFTCYDQRLKGKQVSLIYDVAISWDTLGACAVALKAAGPSSV